MINKLEVYNNTGARVFYDKTRKCNCALWLESGCEHKLYIGKGYTTEQVKQAILEKRLTSYTFNKE